MKIILSNIEFDIFVERKNIKNMYLRIKKDGIYITCNYLVPKSMIISFIKNNEKTILDSYSRVKKKEEKEKSFYYLGKKYDVIVMNTITKIEFAEDRVFVKSLTYLDTFLTNEAKKVFNDRVKVCYSMFDEEIPYPKVIIGKMKRKWGYCNKAENLIKLNFDLIKYPIEEIDYVIVHELCHFLEFNHSKRFWGYVKKYFPDYKTAMKVLKEE